MTPSEIADTLKELFAPTTINVVAPGSWQIETQNLRLLVMLSDDESWLRILLPIVPVQEAQPFLEQFLEANFDETQEVHYALHQNVVWGVFQHNRVSLVVEDFRHAIAQLISLYKSGLDDVFNRLIESRIRQIILAAKSKGSHYKPLCKTLTAFMQKD